MAARHDLVEVDDPVLGPMRQQAAFPRFVGEPERSRRAPPASAQHTREVLTDMLGLTDPELDAPRRRRGDLDEVTPRCRRRPTGLPATGGHSERSRAKPLAR